MPAKKITTEQLIALYMVKYNKTYVTVLELRKFKAKLSKVLEIANKGYKIELDLLGLKNLEKNDFIMVNFVICAKEGKTIKDIEMSLFLNSNIDILMECYTALALYSPNKNGLER